MNTPNFRYIDIKEVNHLTGLTKTPLYARIKSGEFPAPIPLSRNCVRWRSDEVAAWMDRQTEKRDAGTEDRSAKARAAVSVPRVIRDPAGHRKT